jgi:hypothetical protein|tara:strand:+ start:170 stop:676 length:507 start_codon:yes stop_codon:yes gene_type:complete
MPWNYISAIRNKFNDLEYKFAESCDVENIKSVLEKEYEILSEKFVEKHDISNTDFVGGIMRPIFEFSGLNDNFSIESFFESNKNPMDLNRSNVEEKLRNNHITLYEDYKNTAEFFEFILLNSIDLTLRDADYMENTLRPEDFSKFDDLRKKFIGKYFSSNSKLIQAYE